MTQAEKVMIEIINNKCDHARDFMDGDDIETARQVLEEIQEFCNWLYEDKIANIPADTKEKQSILFDLITTRRIDKIL
jgi:hypothetical protein